MKLTDFQLIFSVFKTLTDQRVTVELKNDLSITGTLKSVDQFLNIRLDAIEVSGPGEASSHGVFNHDATLQGGRP
ncbi:hypothetical protein H4582DRAFT_2202597 [Lactarius indigo]|nr:hypothetical protein H4582DRAFT_2202597 [Lactarius indigo]